MRILIAYRYFAPDTPPYASILADITEWLAEAGHEVEVITAQPAYKPLANIPKQPWRETRGNVKVRRVWLMPEGSSSLRKALNGGLFILQAFLIALFGAKRDLLWTATMPPVVQAWMLSLAAKVRGAKFLYHLQDIHPEVSAVQNGTLEKGALFKVMQKMDVAALNRTDCAVVLSTDMRNVLVERGATKPDIRVIRNFALGIDDVQPAKKEPHDGRPARFCFAGNIGRFQHLENLVDAFAEIDPNIAELVIVGDGKIKSTLQAKVADEGIGHVSFRDHMSESDVFKFLQSQDVGIVSLAPGLFRYAFPTKIWTYIAADLPMFALVEDQSELAEFIDGNSLGTSRSWDAKPAELAEAITGMVMDMHQSVPEVAKKEELYHKRFAKAHWTALMAELEGGPSGD